MGSTKNYASITIVFGREVYRARSLHFFSCPRSRVAVYSMIACLRGWTINACLCLEFFDLFPHLAGADTQLYEHASDRRLAPGNIYFNLREDSAYTS